MSLVAGIDEAGRGPLAGPVVAAAVILDPARPIRGLRDSKVLTERQRDRLAVEIRVKRRRLVGGVGGRRRDRPDQHPAGDDARDAARVRGAVGRGRARRWIDGNRCPALGCAMRAIVKGDRDVAVDLGGVDPREDRARRDAGASSTAGTRPTASRTTRATARPSISPRWRGTGPVPRIG